MVPPVVTEALKATNRPGMLDRLVIVRMDARSLPESIPVDFGLTKGKQLVDEQVPSCQSRLCEMFGPSRVPT